MYFIRRAKIAFTAALLLATPGPPAANAQIADAPQSAISLDNALINAKPSAGEVFLAIDAASVRLPNGAAPPVVGDYADKIAWQYGMLVQTEGGVMAIAPATMVVLNTDPGTPDPYADISPTDALALLLSSLDDSQWQSLSSSGSPGLSLADLDNDKQRALWRALFPDQPAPLQAAPDGSNRIFISDAFPTFSRELADTAHLRLGKQVEIAIPLAEPNERGPAHGYVTKPNLDEQAALNIKYALYPVWQGEESPVMAGQPVRSIVPNVPKPSGLDYDAQVLRAPVDLIGVKTVDDLIDRVAYATHVEVYAEPTYGKLPVTTVGNGTVTAGDILRSVALCVCGTYRQLGPAFVLTDDQLGVGVRRAMIVHYEEEIDAARDSAASQAGDTIFTVRHGLNGVGYLDPASALSPAEEQSFMQMEQMNYGTNLGAPLPINVSYAQLSPEQRSVVDQQVANQDDSNQMYGNSHLTTSSDFMLNVQPVLILTAPAIDGAVLMNSYLDMWNNLFNPSERVRRMISPPVAENAASENSALPVPAPTHRAAAATNSNLIAAEAAYPVRAALVGATSANDIDRIISGAKRAGLNQVWLDAFSGGQLHLKAINSGGGENLLARAIRLGKRSGIAVTAVVSLLKWDKNTQAGAEDLTLEGIPFSAALAYDNKLDAIRNGATDDSPAPWLLDATQNYLSPFGAGAALSDLIHLIARTPGLAAIALRDESPPGYDPPNDNGSVDQYHTTLGYTPAMRLMFLRQSHVDPVDISTDVPYEQNPPDMRLPYFPDQQSIDPAATDWAKFRHALDISLLESLYPQAVSSNGRPTPMWLANPGGSSGDTGYSEWDGTAAHLPPLSILQRYQAVDGMVARNAPPVKAPPEPGIVTLHKWQAATPNALAANLRGEQMKGSIGFVIDYSAAGDWVQLAQLAPLETADPSAGDAVK